MSKIKFDVLDVRSLVEYMKIYLPLLKYNNVCEIIIYRLRNNLTKF